jgi:hypothetical protein
MRSCAGVVLWNVRAERLAVGSDEWEYALELAASQGWRKRGTRQPPVSLDGEPQPPWDGRYFPGIGQEVTAPDARELGKVLDKATAQRFSGTIQRIVRFVSGGGFLICALPAPANVGLTALMTTLDADRMRSGGVPLPSEERDAARPDNAAESYLWPLRRR